MLLWEELGKGFLILLCIPFVLLVIVIVGSWILPFIPILAIGFIVWAVIKIKSWQPEKVVIPKTAQTFVPRKKRKPFMVGYKGQKVPLGVFILSMIFSLVFGVILIALMLLVIPIWLDLLIVIGFAIASRKKKVK